MFASSFYVAVEPAPSDLLFLVVLACFLGSGLTISATVVPLVVFLLLYNFGGFISFLQVAGDEKARMFVITSFYMAFSAIFLAFYVAYDPLRRMAIIKNALVIAAVIASLLGVLGYFDVAGLGRVFSQNIRAVQHIQRSECVCNLLDLSLASCWCKDFCWERNARNSSP